MSEIKKDVKNMVYW